jgi:hypothetical protein
VIEQAPPHKGFLRVSLAAGAGEVAPVSCCEEIQQPTTIEFHARSCTAITLEGSRRVPGLEKRLASISVEKNAESPMNHTEVQIQETCDPSVPNVVTD